MVKIYCKYNVKIYHRQVKITAYIKLVHIGKRNPGRTVSNQINNFLKM